MKLTANLKSWLVENCAVKAVASDDEFRAATGNAFADGTLTREKYAELTLSEKAVEANQFAGRLDKIADGLEKLTTLLTVKETAKPEPKPEPEKAKKEEEKPTADEMTCKECGWKGAAPGDGKCPECGASLGGKAAKPATKAVTPKASKMAMLFANNGHIDNDVDVRVKAAVEMYPDERKTLIYPTVTKAGRPHPFAGQPVRDYSETGRLLNDPSPRDKAVIGAWGKFLCNTALKRSRNLAWMSMPSHDKELILHAMEHYEWAGATDGGDYCDINRRKLTELEQKALIDDSTSGGIEAVPLVFDDDLISTPILSGELFPLVNVVPLDKGRRIQGAAAGTVGSEWGGVDDTAVTLFDTTSFVSSFDTTIYRWQGSIKIGLDFLSDTPIDFAQFLTAQYGEVLLRELDEVIAAGDGTTQPEGIMTKSGTTSVAWGGTTSIGNYESLRFGVHKREHSPNMMRTAVFCGTDTSYQRAMAIPVGSSDNRRLTNTTNMANYDGYTWMGRPYKICEQLTNAQIFYAILGRYRMYRRRGLTIRTSQEGDTLIRGNEVLIVASGRFGGQLERGACAAITSTAPA